MRDEVTSQAEELRDLLSRETFFRDLPAVDQHARAIETEYARRFEDALRARVHAYENALQLLAKAPGWNQLPDEVRIAIAAPIVHGTMQAPPTAPLALLRSERDACESRLRAAIRSVQEALEGERLASVNVNAYFSGGIETEEQLDAALQGLRDECVKLIGAGKKIIVQ